MLNQLRKVVLRDLEPEPPEPVDSLWKDDYRMVVPVDELLSRSPYTAAEWLEMTSSGPYRKQDRERLYAFLSNEWKTVPSVRIFKKASDAPFWFRQLLNRRDALARMRDLGWWEKQINQLARRENDHRERLRGRIGGDVMQSLFVSDEATRYRKQKNANQRNFVRKVKGTKNPIHPKLLRAGLSRTFAKAIAAHMTSTDSGYTYANYHLTLESQLRDRDAGTAPDVLAAVIRKRISKVFDLARKTRPTNRFIGCYMLEPHVNGVPHVHMLLFGDENGLAWVKSELRKRFPGTHGVVESRNRTAAFAVSYMFKLYLGDKGFSPSAKFANMDAWSSTYRINPLAWIGFKKGTISTWERLRKSKSDSELAENEKTLQKHVLNWDYLRFLKEYGTI